MRLFIPIVDENKFKENVKKTNSCHFWIGRTGSRGYGILHCKLKGLKRSRNVGAHRIAYFIEYGPFDSSLYVCHKCDTPGCVNPRHLFLGSAKDNAKDRDNKRRGVNSRKDFCLNGHEFNLVNTYYNKYNQRICRVCDRKRATKRRK